MDYAPGIRESAILDENISSSDSQKYKTPVIVGCGNDGIIKDIFCDNPSATGTMAVSGDPYISMDGIIRITTAGDIGTMAYQISKDGGITYSEAFTSESGEIDIGDGVIIEFGGTAFIEDDEYHFTTIGGMKPNTLTMLTPNNYEEIVGESSELANWLTAYFNLRVNGLSPSVCLAVRPKNDLPGEIGDIVKKPAMLILPGDIAVSGTPTRNRSITVEIVKSGDCGEAKAAIYDGGNVIQEPFTLPPDSEAFVVDNILFTTTNGDTTPIMIPDTGNTGTATADISGTQTADMNLLVEITTGGNIGTAIFKYSKDNGTTWIEDTTTAASVDVGDGISVTFDDNTGVNSFAVGDKWKSIIRVKSFNKGDKFTCDIKAPYSSNRLSAITEDNTELRTKIKNAENYGFFVLPFPCELTEFNIVKTLLRNRETERKSYAWYVIQTKDLNGETDLFDEDTGLFSTLEWFKDMNCDPVAGYHDFTVGDKIYKTPNAILMAAKRNLQEVYESPASASEKSMDGVGKLYNEELFLKYEQEFYNNQITITHQRPGTDTGWFFSNPYIKSGQGSYYDRVYKVAVIQKAMDLLRNFLLQHVEDPLKAPDGAVGLALTTLMLNARDYISREMSTEINNVTVELKQPMDVAIKELFDNKDIQVNMKVFNIPIPSTFSLYGTLSPSTGGN